MTARSDDRRPTVLVLASTYPRWRDDPEPGFVHELCRRLVERFNVVALVPDAPGADPSGPMDGVEIVRYRYAPRRWQTLVNHGGIATNLKRSLWKWLLVPGFLLGQYLAARKLVRRRGIDVVHAHWLVPQGVIASLLGLPYLVTSHGGDLFGLRGRVLNRLKRRVARSSAAMTVVSSAMAEEARRLGLEPPSLTVLPMGADLQTRFVPTRGKVARSTDELLFVGRLVPKKGLTHLLDALPLVLARRPATTLTIVGFGPEEGALHAQAKRLRIDDRIRFAGPVEQRALPAFFDRAAVFVAPFVRDASGNQEGLPVALMEAIGCECPAVVGDVAGIHDLLGDDARTISVDPREPTSLATAILAMLEDPQAARARARALRAKLLDRVDWQVIADRYGRLLAAIRR
ncbi:glycosyltransferase [Dokdonella fugitiva]|jgi:glycosyltransferase involved in cell wall biosynthesis|uniref:glycosyltransferase n=1 Tax=Dokdonella fugitiva TaxID=328517 RepID=UPI0015F94F0A|nr:glycosyltransferase [Dokdonella fugitiva]MBA8882554.1 glycosyltransferase involved in cell wall biosynthesis [Dokdonella fugitiva]